MDLYTDRKAAGAVLAQNLMEYKNKPNTVVLALPRGGVPVAYEIAKALSLPLDVFIVRKLGVPGHEELAMGAIASGGTVVFNQSLLHQINLKQADIDAVVQAEQKELTRREHLYRGDRPFPKLQGTTVILVDDGIATGASMQAAIKALHQYNPAQIIIAVPVAAASTCEEMKSLANKLICPLQPQDFHAVGLWYEHFNQTSDNEVIALLKNNS